MKYNLEKFDEVINNILTRQDKNLDGGLSRLSVIEVLQKENVRIKREVRETAFRLKSNTEIEHYIHNQQLVLENLIAAIVKEINPERWKELYKIESEHSERELLKIVFIKLEELQLFLEDEYSKYLDLDRLIPYHSFMKKLKAIYPKVEIIRKSKTSEGLSIEFLEIICKQLDIKHKKGVTYDQFNYYVEFTNELFNLFTTENESISDETILHFLVEMNHNTKTFFKLQIRKISEDLAILTSNRDKIDYLLRIKKNYEQINVIGRPSQFKNRKSHRKKIVNWVSAEIKYLSRNKNFEKPIPIQAIPLPTQKNKMRLNLSVAQLSCFFKIIHTAGIISTTNQKEIFRFVADNIETPNTANISAASFGAKYYNIEASTRDAVTSTMIKLLNIIRHN